MAGDPNKPRWVIDPLDGTTNFLHGLPHFAISIAVAGAARRRQGLGRGQHRPDLPADDRRELLGREEPGRLAARPAAAGVGAAGHERGRDRDGHSVSGSWRFRAVEPHFRGTGSVRCRHPSLRLGGARSRLGRGRALRWLLGKRPVALGRLGRHIAGARGGRLVTDFRGGSEPVERREILAGNDVLHSKLHKLLAGALR